MDAPTVTIGENAPALSAVDLLTGRGFITGKSGSGKSNTASVIIEELLALGFAMLIVDTDGEYYGLKEEYELLHVGAGEGCDLNVGPEHAGKLAQLMLEKNVPVILDVSAYIEAEAAPAMIQKTCQALYEREHAERRPFPIFVEEVHEYLPEGTGLDDVGRTLIRIAKRGRKRGLGFCGISQRPADVKKGFITQCDYLFWHRLTWDNDTAVVRRVVSPGVADEVAALGDGEAFLVADFMEDGEDVSRVQVRPKHTFDAGATPGLGSGAGARPALKALSGTIAEELEAITERTRTRTDALARAREKNEALQNEIERLEEELERQQDVTKLANRLTDAFGRAGINGQGEAAGAVEGEMRQALAEAQEELRHTRAERDGAQDALAQAESRIEELEGQAIKNEQLARFEQHQEEMVEATQRLAAGLGIELGESDKLRERTRKQAQEIEALKERLAAGGPPAPIDPSVEEFLEDDHVRRGIAAAKEGASPRYVDGILLALVTGEDGTVEYQQVADQLGVANTTHVSTAACALKEQGVVRLEGTPRQVELDLAGLAGLHRRAERSKRAEGLLADL